jgi:hypothetical protein
MKSICEQFPLTNAEWMELEDKLDNLVRYAAWQLLKMNAKNSHTDEIDDVTQELRWSIYLAGCYSKRQVYIESCFKVAKKYVKDIVVSDIVQELEDLWNNRTRHGAGRVKYGDFQQELLERIIDQYVPDEEKPDRNKVLKVDSKFMIYCKSILWNSKKSMGKKISREKSWRTGLVSLSEIDHLASA